MGKWAPSGVTVIPLLGLKKSLGYRVPESLRERVAVGSLVRVPVIRRKELAVVCALEAPKDYPRERLKYIVEVLHAYPVLGEDLLRLAEWMQG